MLDILRNVERALPALLEDEPCWKSVFVDYHPPFVERLWTQYGPNRVYLHRILPLAPGEVPLFHPHPWPSAMRVLSGRYGMNVGYGEGLQEPPKVAYIELPADATYEMTHPDGWHDVSPLGEPSISLMVSGPPWCRESHKSTKELRSLEGARREAILAFFREVYKKTT